MTQYFDGHVTHVHARKLKGRITLYGVWEASVCGLIINFNLTLTDMSIKTFSL